MRRGDGQNDKQTDRPTDERMTLESGAIPDGAVLLAASQR